jgi:hypothetical protein
MCFAAFSLLAKFCQNVNLKIRNEVVMEGFNFLTIKILPDFFLLGFSINSQKYRRKSTNIVY